MIAYRFAFKARTARCGMVWPAYYAAYNAVKQKTLIYNKHFII